MRKTWYRSLTDTLGLSIVLEIQCKPVAQNRSCIRLGGQKTVTDNHVNHIVAVHYTEQELGATPSVDNHSPVQELANECTVDS